MAKATTKKITKAFMIRDAQAELGADAAPIAIQAHIQSKFNKTIPTTTISNYKSVFKNKGNKGGKRGRKRSDPGLRIDDIETVTVLVRRLGADQVKRLVEAIG
jgi:hypothetical protein